MKSEIFVEFLNYMNNKMKLQKRKILVFLDNCPSHPDIKLSNVTLWFIPKNTTSQLQPLDLGVIAWLKSEYKKLLMVDIRHAMKDCEDIVQFAKKVTIFDGIINTKDAWEKLPTETIV